MKIWNLIKYYVYRFNKFMEGVPILGFPWRIIMVVREKDAIFQMSMEVGEALLDSTEKKVVQWKGKLNKKKK